MEQVQAAVDTYISSIAGRVIETHVEFGDEYAGYVTAVDVYAPSEAETNAAAAELAAGLAPLLPGLQIATDLDLERAQSRLTV